MRSSSKRDRDFLARMGGVFASIRKSSGLTQEALAWATRLHVNTISNIERGLSDPSIFALGLLCFGLGCPRIDLDESGLMPRFEPATRLPPQRFRSMVWGHEAARVHASSFKARRLAAGLGLREVAAVAGVHPNTVWNFENARAAPSSTAAFRLYAALGVTVIDGIQGAQVRRRE